LDDGRCNKCQPHTHNNNNSDNNNNNNNKNKNKIILVIPQVADCGTASRYRG
jgi:hypothetical protein